MSKRLARHLLGTSCGIITGDRGAGKSTLFAFIVDVFQKEGFPVYCQYPYKGCYQIPMKSSIVNGIERYDIDKEWLYSTNLSGCCILIDEARTVWPARSYAKWTVADEDFFKIKYFVPIGRFFERLIKKSMSRNKFIRPFTAPEQERT